MLGRLLPRGELWAAWGAAAVPSGPWAATTARAYNARAAWPARRLAPPWARCRRSGPLAAATLAAGLLHLRGLAAAGLPSRGAVAAAVAAAAPRAWPPGASARPGRVAQSKRFRKTLSGQCCGSERSATAGGAAEAATGSAAPGPAAEAALATAASAAASAAAPPVCVLVCGIPGTGKSTLCRVLCGTFERCVWVNQDQFVFNPGAKIHARSEFLTAVRGALAEAAAAAGPASSLVLVDKVNVLAEHRQSFLEQVAEVGFRDRGGRLVLLELVGGSRGELYDFCFSRIQGRGAAHRSLRPSAELPGVLRRMLRMQTPPGEDELRHFDARLRVDVALEPVDKAMKLMSALQGLGFQPAVAGEVDCREDHEWVVFPADGPRPTFCWNRVSEASAWAPPARAMPAWHGFVDDEGRPYFRSTRTFETTWDFPPLPEPPALAPPARAVAGLAVAGAGGARGAEGAGAPLEARLGDAWRRLRSLEHAWRRIAEATEAADAAEGRGAERREGEGESFGPVMAAAAKAPHEEPEAQGRPRRQSPFACTERRQLSACAGRGA